MPPRKKNKNPACWTDDDFRIFISHLSPNKADAQELKKYLETFAINGFVAHSDIEPSKEWQNEIELALKTCDAFIALLVPKFPKSKWTDQEVGFAVARDIPVFPVAMGILPYGFMGKYQAHFFHDFEKLAKDIYSFLIKDKKTKGKMAHAVLNYLEASPNFVAANNRSILVKDISSWDETLIQKLTQIFEQEAQVNGATTASSRVQKVLREFTLRNERSLAETFKGKWVNNYRHHSGRYNSERFEIKNDNEYYANGKLAFTIDQVGISDNQKNVRFRKTHVSNGHSSFSDLELIEPNVYQGTEKGSDGTSKVQYRKLKVR